MSKIDQQSTLQLLHLCIYPRLSVFICGYFVTSLNYFEYFATLCGWCTFCLPSGQGKNIQLIPSILSTIQNSKLKVA